YNNTVITYFTKANAENTYHHLENKKLLEEDANFEQNFIGGQILSTIIGYLGKTVDVIKIGVEYEVEKEESKNKITIETAREVAGSLSMEFAIEQNESTPFGSPPNLEVQLFPTEASYEMLDRWKEVYKINSEIPYPKDQIESLDWYGIAEYLATYDTQISSDLSDYITEGTLSGNQSVEKVAENKD